MTFSKRMTYITGLDGIRALAVMAVLCYHADFPWALGGFLGVETFFVLSGFLITSLLLLEWQETGGIDLQNFWLRRARRLLPALWLLLLILPFLAELIARDASPHLREDVPAAFFYITNWVYIVREVPYFEAFGRPPLLQHLWSLAVEEQFYMLWPIILLMLLRAAKKNRAGLLSTIFVLIGLSFALMAILYCPTEDSLRIYYGTDTRASGFLIGGVLAMLWPDAHQSSVSDKRKFEILGWAGLISLLVLYNLLNEFQPFLYHGGILLTALATALLIMGASSPSTVLSKFLENPILRWIGTRSYGIYLWHWPIFMLTRPGIDVQLPALPLRIGQLAIAFGLAELSFRWVEYPIRHHGLRSSVRSWQTAIKRWSIPKRLSLSAGILSVSMLLIWQGFIRPRENFVIIENASLAIETVTLTPAIMSLETTQVSPAASPLPRATRTTPSKIEGTGTAVVEIPKVTLIGDSIMQGASPMIEDVLGDEIYVDAARKRRMEDVPDLIEDLSNDGHLGPVVVLHLGSNRPFDAAVFDLVMESLIRHKVTRMIFINVHRPIGWEFYANRQFAEGIERWPQAELIDWESLAHSEQAWFIDDQTHLSYRGSEAYVAAIQAKLETAP